MRGISYERIAWRLLGTMAQINGGIIYVFMMGITDGRKDFDFNRSLPAMNVAGMAGIGVYDIHGAVTVFIPCFKWNRHYYVQTTCCNTLYELDPEIGRRIARGEDVEILPQHLQRVNPQYGYGFENGSGNTIKRCSNCGYTTTEDFEFCPKCGRRL